MKADAWKEYKKAAKVNMRGPGLAVAHPRTNKWISSVAPSSDHKELLLQLKPIMGAIVPDATNGCWRHSYRGVRLPSISWQTRGDGKAARDVLDLQWGAEWDHSGRLCPHQEEVDAIPD